MPVIGLDTSMTSTGVAVIDDDGSIQTWAVKSAGKRGDDLVMRAVRIEDIVQRIFDLVPDDGELVLIESPSFGSIGAGTHDRSGLWWRVVHMLMAQGHSVAMMPPTSLKKWVTGSGRADKKEVQAAIAVLFPNVVVKTNDEADAAGLAHVAAVYSGYPVDKTEAHNATGWAAVKWPAAA